MTADGGVQFGLVYYHMWNLAPFVIDGETLTDCTGAKYKQY